MEIIKSPLFRNRRFAALSNHFARSLDARVVINVFGSCKIRCARGANAPCSGHVLAVSGHALATLAFAALAVFVVCSGHTLAILASDVGRNSSYQLLFWPCSGHVWPCSGHDPARSGHGLAMHSKQRGVDMGSTWADSRRQLQSNGLEFECDLSS